MLGAFLRRSGVALSIPRRLLLSLLPSRAQSPLGPSSTSSCPNKTQYTEVNTRMQPPADGNSEFFCMHEPDVPLLNKDFERNTWPAIFSGHTDGQFSTSRRRASPSPDRPRMQQTADERVLRFGVPPTIPTNHTCRPFLRSEYLAQCLLGPQLLPEQQPLTPLRIVHGHHV